MNAEGGRDIRPPTTEKTNRNNQPQDITAPPPKTQRSSPGAVYGASPVKRRKRSTKAEMLEFRQAIFEITAEVKPATVRHIYYRLVAADVIDKTESDYRRVQNELVKMRRDWWRYFGCKKARTGVQAIRKRFPDRNISDLVAFHTVALIDAETRGVKDPAEITLATCVPFSWISDNTRYTIRPTTWSSWEAALENTARTYRRALWDEADVYVEIWCESDSIAGVIDDVTAEYDVPLNVCRGFSSLGPLYRAAEVIANTGKPAYLYFFGDHDPSGKSIEKKVREEVGTFAEEAEIYFERVAVTPEQIEEWNLPTKPPKKTDSRSKSFTGGTVEIEAIPPDDLRAMARRCIEQHVDQHQLGVLLAAEKSERKILLELAGEMA